MTTAYDVPYMQRTREYYRAQGYETDYKWAHFDTIPFRRLDKNLGSARVSLITTTMPDTPEGRSHRQVYATPAKPVPASMYTDALSWDKKTTHTNDVSSFLPLEILQRFVDDGLIGALDSYFYSVPTEYSQRNTREKDAPRILQYCRDAQADIALLVPL